MKQNVKIASLLLLLLSVDALAKDNDASNYQVSTNANGTLTIDRYIGNDKNVAIPSDLYGMPVSSIGMSAFELYINLISVNVPDSVQEIQHYAFYHDVFMTRAILGSNITNIGFAAFAECVDLKTINVPATMLLDGAFAKCYSLQNVSIGTNLTYIGRNAFTQCYSLKSLVMPKSLQVIDNLAFVQCISLKALYFEGDAPYLGENIFAQTPDVVIYYHTNTLGWTNTFGGRPTATW